MIESERYVNIKMKTYVALLRGINVGGNNKIEMSRLKLCFESLGYSNVKTYINSGNVVFQTDIQDIAGLTKEIMQIIQDTFDLKIPVLLRDKGNMKNVCQSIPNNWVNDKDYKSDVLFLWDEFASKETLDIIEKNPEVDTLLYADGAIIWHVAKRNYPKSKMSDIVGTEIYRNMTVRNVNTVRKLLALMENIDT